jgi:hypothetical protein
MRALPVVLVACLLGTFASAGATSLGQPCDAAYAQALQAADLFLWAWTTCDSELGRQMLSTELREKHLPDSTWHGGWSYMEGMSNPHPLAFEITGGRLLSPTHAEFSVTLFEHYSGEPAATRYQSTIQLVHEASAAPAAAPLIRSRVAGRLTEWPEWRVSVLPATKE